MAALLTRAHAGPALPTAKKGRKTATAKKDRRVAARTKVATPTMPGSGLHDDFGQYLTVLPVGSSS
ncbi:MULTISPECIES: hypothetical protein [unclassified Streptomyces]|uniref:hypothetical protein n=1 Tax=unclassified Streptomyces TaxID=2593676 RepID=UPI00081D56F0|nr:MULTISPECIES: hypothetical protein [unclassified Streptomyces]SCE40583.1 hypothetical protein GA0115243_1116178 [Streptomyces sp. ScaeMP-e83]